MSLMCDRVGSLPSSAGVEYVFFFFEAVEFFQQERVEQIRVLSTKLALLNFAIRN